MGVLEKPPCKKQGERASGGVEVKEEGMSRMYSDRRQSFLSLLHLCYVRTTSVISLLPPSFYFILKDGLLLWGSREHKYLRSIA